MTEPVSRALTDSPVANEVRIVPLGGLGEIGMNCLAVEQADGIVVVDCGITFPDDDVGIDTYHPDFAYLEARRERVAALFLTHGHEDHVGAVPYLLARMNVRVFGPPHALAVARHRLLDKRMDPRGFEMITTTPGQHYAVGPFDVEPIRVTHSITDATALAIRTRAGIVIHTGDFRFDPAPADGELTDEARFSALGDEGVRLLMSDSTNIDSRSAHISETAVGETLERLIAACPGRAVVGMFASNMQRLRMMGDICQRLGRKLSLFGRSIELHVQWGHEIGRLHWPSDLIVSRDDAARVSPDRLVVLAGGTQAEPNSSLMKLANRMHPQLELTPDDTLILSSRVIPGNDRPVYDMMASFLRQRVAVKSWISDPGVHTSGHAHRDEQGRMIELVRPRGFIPLHGTRHHLERHAELAREHAVPEILVLENGDVGQVRERGLAIEGHVDVGRIATWQGIDIAPAVVRERRSLARSGVLTVQIVLDDRGRLGSTPSVRARGVLAGEDDPATLRFVAVEVAKALSASEGKDERSVADLARLAARRAIEGKTGKKPVCLVHVSRV
jgi:ribonuclease J